MANNGSVTFEIVQNLGELRGENDKGWKKEINIVNWNNSGNKIDIREWSNDHTKMTKGITLFKEEFINLKQILENAKIDTEILK